MNQDFQSGASRAILANIAIFSNQCLNQSPIQEIQPDSVAVINPLQLLLQAWLASTV